VNVVRGEIVVEDVHKSFRAYHSRTVKDVLIRAARGEPLSERRPVLQGVDFRVSPGERVGIVGRNGAGKSTLFRLMSGIYRPERGRIVVGGRISPLIEITSGLVLDLTGRENIHLNSVVLGLSRAEARQRFDAIVAFAGLEDFVDTPVRYYSSGMQARLGFSVVAHVDADVVLIDEVLAVGDIEFQQRCVARMRQLNERGATIVFVSHDAAQLRALCPRVVMLTGGRVVADGPAAMVLGAGAEPAQGPEA
jgi:ABC-type polysaccharide/polyol phosphate transport system ATPase subunit